MGSRFHPVAARPVEHRAVAGLLERAEVFDPADDGEEARLMLFAWLISLPAGCDLAAEAALLRERIRTETGPDNRLAPHFLEALSRLEASPRPWRKRRSI
jgi:hypothetical protein